MLLLGSAGGRVAGDPAGREGEDADCARRTRSLLGRGGEHYVTIVPGTKHLSLADVGLFRVVPPPRPLMPAPGLVRIRR